MIAVRSALTIVGCCVMRSATMLLMRLTFLLVSIACEASMVTKYMTSRTGTIKANSTAATPRRSEQNRIALVQSVCECAPARNMDLSFSCSRNSNFQSSNGSFCQVTDAKCSVYPLPILDITVAIKSVMTGHL